jgi:glycosyltransferase involved in cell wall biosynthesis
MGNGTTKKSVSVLITCFNSERFIEKSVQSALDQSRSPDEIVVVDDGSTDKSFEILNTRFGHEKTVRLIGQKNQGQTGALATAFESCTGDLLFFMDGDDTYGENHINDIASVFEQNPSVDFIFTGYIELGHSESECLPLGDLDRDLGYSVIRTIIAGESVGGMTSMNAMRRNLACKVFPPPKVLVEEGDAYGDRLLLIGASIMGGRKYYRAKTSVNYLQHENNHSRKGVCQKHNFRFLLNNIKTVQAYQMRACIPSDIAKYALSEFRTIELPTKRELFLYLRIILSSKISFTRKLDRCFSALKHFYRKNIAFRKTARR